MKLNLFLYKLECKIRRVAIEHLMTILSVCMLIVFAADTFLALYTDGQAAYSIYSLLAFDRALIFKGQVWRVISFIFCYPDAGNIFFTLLALYFYYWVGASLDSYWGKARFNLFYLFGIVGTIIAGFIIGYIDNMYLNLSLFLAFATMFPDVKVLIFFILPIKVKWLGILEGAALLWLFFISSFLSIFGWAIKAAIIAALLNYALFCGYDLIRNIKRAYEEYQWRKGR